MSRGLRKKGFTLIEITLGIILLVVIIAITTPLVSNVIARNDVGTAHESLYNSLLRAQQLSKNQYKDSQWRVCLDNTNKQYTITSGTCSDSTNAEIIKISSNITISSTQTLDILFKAISGELDNTSNYPTTITLTGGGASKSIIINKKGILSKSPTAEEIAAAIPPPKLTVTSCTYTNKKISIPYTAGEVGYNYASQTINSTGVTGLTATLLGSGPLATGGDTVTDITVGTDTYRVHRFTTVGTSSLNVIQGGQVEYLVVAGGGGGGETIGGGGGGGQVKSGTLSLSSNITYTISTGAGGAGGFGSGYPGGVSGSSSSISGTGITTITSLGGGGGGGYNLTGTGSGGGQGGGQGAGGGAGVSAGSGQNAGGTSSSNTNSGAGGGGVGSVGSNATSGNPGSGGTGISSDITGTSLFYAAGGGGGARNPSGGTGASGGSGVGGSGGTGAANGSSGANGTGSGGGGGGYRNSPVFEGAGGNGGSGIVIVRYKLGGGPLASSGTLEYAVTGTPSGAGTANFNLGNIGNTGVGCNNSNIAVNVTGTAGDPHFANVSLLLHGNGTNGSTTIIDGSPSSKTVTAVGNAQISTVQSKFGGSSMYFDGVGDYVESPANNAFAYGTGDFTVEMWLYPASGMSGGRVFYNNLLSAGNNTGFYLWTHPASAGFYSIDLLPNDFSYIVNSSANDIQANQWSHFAVTRSGTTVRGFINGTQIWFATSGLNVTANRIRLANPLGNTSGSDWSGYIDDLRITKGVARYTGNFTPPTDELPKVANTITY